MTNLYIAVAAALIVVLMAVVFGWWAAGFREGFDSRREKAEAIVGWFSRNPVPKYSKYRADLNKESNIVEYEDALAARETGTLTVDNMMKVL